MGIALAVELRRATLPKIRLGPAGVALAAVYAVLSWAPLRWVAEPVFIPFLALVLVAAAQRDLEGRPTVWSWRPLVLLGERSYAFYLLHQLVIRVWARAYRHHLMIASGAVGAVWFVAILAVAVGAASVLFRVVEVPSERRLRGSGSRRLELDDVR